MDGGNWICVQDEYWLQRFPVRKESDGVHGERNGGARRKQLDETGNIIGVGGGLVKKWRLVRKSQKDLDKVLTKFLIAGGPSGRAGAGA